MTHRRVDTRRIPIRGLSNGADIAANFAAVVDPARVRTAFAEGLAGTWQRITGSYCRVVQRVFADIPARYCGGPPEDDGARRAKSDSGLPRVTTRRRNRLLQSAGSMEEWPNARGRMPARRGGPIGPDAAFGAPFGKGREGGAPRRSIRNISNLDRSASRRLLLLIGLISL